MRAIDRGAGALLWDREGRRYIDGSGGAVVVNIGHGRGEVAAAMAEQAGTAAYVHGTPLHERRHRGVRAAAGEARSGRLQPPLPRLGRLGGQRDGREAGARVPSGERGGRRATR